MTTTQRAALTAAVMSFAQACAPLASSTDPSTQPRGIATSRGGSPKAQSDTTQAPRRELQALGAPIACDSCEEWNRPHEPFKIYGNTYYVGPEGLSSVMIVSSKGLLVLDGGLPQTAPVIDANIRKLGFRTEDIRLIVNSHAHYDHAGGIAALQRLSGARVAASAQGAQALARGEPTEDDPQYRSGHEQSLHFPRVTGVEVVSDGQSLTVGDVTITAHLTPGHTPGSTTWTWRSCEGGRCVQIVYADSLNPISDDGFQFKGGATHASLFPAFRQSIAKVDRLPCDVMIAVHPGFSNMDDKLAARKQGVTPDPFIDPNACHAYAADALQKLTKRMAAEN